MSCHGLLLLACVAWMLATDTDIIDAYWTMRARLERTLRAIDRRDRTDRHFRGRQRRAGR